MWLVVHQDFPRPVRVVRIQIPVVLVYPLVLQKQVIQKQVSYFILYGVTFFLLSLFNRLINYEEISFENILLFLSYT